MEKLLTGSLFILVLFQGSFALKCYVCNSAFIDGEPADNDACRYPDKYPGKVKAEECTTEKMKELTNSWMSEQWNFDHNSVPYNDGHGQQDHHEFGGYQKNNSYTLKCMKEILHKDSKPWLKGKNATFSQVVRFCEYRLNGDNCDKPCDAKQLETGSCYLCCSGDLCNSASKFGSIWAIIGVMTSFLLFNVLPN